MKYLSEQISILSALLLAAAAAYFFWFMPGWSPASDWPKYMLAWFVVAYLTVQLVALLQHVLLVRLTGMIDSVAAIVPLVVGLVVMINAAQGTVRLSGYQQHALYLLLATSLLDFIVTMWIRFVVNRRTLGIETGIGTA